MRRFAQSMLILLAVSFNCQAEEVAAPGYASVEDNMRAMDKDRDGVVTVFEVRAYIESRHGKDYEKSTLDDMESSAYGKSCSTPFARAWASY